MKEKAEKHEQTLNWTYELHKMQSLIRGSIYFPLNLIILLYLIERKHTFMIRKQQQMVACCNGKNKVISNQESKNQT